MEFFEVHQSPLAIYNRDRMMRFRWNLLCCTEWLAPLLTALKNRKGPDAL